MPELDVKIGRRSYAIACQDGEQAHLTSAAELMNAEAEQVLAASDRLPESRVLLMAGLMLADRISGSSDQERYADGRIEELEAKLRDAEQRATAAEERAQATQAVQSAAPATSNAEAETALNAIAEQLDQLVEGLEAQVAG